MPTYAYTVVNQEGKKLTGTIEAANEAGARDELNKLGFPVLDVAEIKSETTTENATPEDTSTVPKFEFSAVDQNGRKVVGTIAGADKYAAFKRLVGEYRFAVETLCLSTLSPDAKEEERHRGVVDLYTTLKQEEGAVDHAAQEQAELLSENERERLVQEQVDFVLKKIEVLFAEFETELKPEDKATIGKKVERLTRLRTSKNLDYVKHLAEDLLMYVQNQEIYVAQAGNDKRLRSFTLDAKRLITEIHREKIGASLRQQILTAISAWKARHGEESMKNIINRCINAVASWIENILTEPQEVTLLKDKIHILKSQIWDYYWIYLKEKTMEGRKEIKDTIRNLKEQRDELDHQYIELKKKYAEDARTQEPQTALDKAIQAITEMAGWLLAIYVTLHVIGTYAKTRILPIALSGNWLAATQSRTFLMTIWGVLLAYTALTLRINNRWRLAITAPIVVVAMFITTANL